VWEKKGRHGGERFRENAVQNLRRWAVKKRHTFHHNRETHWTLTGGQPKKEVLGRLANPGDEGSKLGLDSANLKGRDGGSVQN